MKEDFVREQEEVVALKARDKYDEAIAKSKEVLRIIEEKYPDDYYNLCDFNLLIAMCYRNKNQYKKAINYVFKSKTYTTNLKQHMECNWVLGNCFYSLKQYNKAIKFYKQCSDYLRNNNIKDQLIRMDFNIAKIENDDNKIIDLIMEAYKLIEDDVNSFKNAEWFFNNAYETLCEIYIDRNETNKIEENIAKINDKNIVVKLRDKMQAINHC